MEKCQRCSKKPITLQCFNCPIINRICSLCDKIIHNTQIKIDHVRVPIENVTLNLKDNTINSNKEEPNNNKMILIENNSQEESKEDENFNNERIRNFSTILPMKNSSEIIDNINTNIQNNINTNDLSTLNQSKNMEDKTIENNNTKKYRNTKYYLLKGHKSFNDIQQDSSLEKEELEYKNKILENSITKLKIEFNDHVAYLTKELETNQSTNDLNIKLITNNYKNKIDEMKKNNEMEICSLKEEINNTKNDKTELNNSFIEEINQKNQIIQNLQKENEELKNELNLKKEEIEKLHKSFDELTFQYETKFEEQKNLLMKDCQDKIEAIIKKFESAKDALIESIDTREIEIKEILDIKNNEIKKLNVDLKNLKEELNCHKINLIKIRDDKNILLKENEFLKNKTFKNECDGKMQISEINNLKKENDELYQQIDKLKIELSKLDMLIYGKVRNKF